MTTIECEQLKENFNENELDLRDTCHDVENNTYTINAGNSNCDANTLNNNENVIRNDIDTHHYYQQQQHLAKTINDVPTNKQTPPPTLENARQQLVEFNALKCADQLLAVTKDTCSDYNEETQFHADFDDNLQPLTERWSPLGANYDDTMSANSELISPASELELLSVDSQAEKHAVAELTRLRSMEDEQEMLTQSLMALTSHFAQVQLRVRQIVEAPSDERDQLLKDLEEFAFQGIPESQEAEPSTPKRCSSSLTNASSDNNTIQQQQQRQFELIEQLKSQLIELEKIAYESGAPVLPQHMLLEKQRIIIDELKQKLNLKLEEHELPVLSSEELKHQVDNAIGEFIGPLKMKDQLVAQLKTQITDLERFIAFLQCDTSDTAKAITANEKYHEAYNSYAAKKKVVQSCGVAVRAVEAGSKPDVVSKAAAANKRPPQVEPTGEQQEQQGVRESLNSKAHGLLDKASLLMQMFASTHFGAKPDHFQKNTLKKTTKGNHWGDLRAQLEVDIQEVASLAATLNYDREKLANMKRAMKMAAAAAAASSSKAKTAGLATIHEQQDHGSGALAKLTTLPTQKNAQKAYALSSEESDDDDSDADIYDTYTWAQSNTRRMRVKGDSINTLAKELTTAVRKNFCMTLQRLIQHGLRVEVESAASSLMVPFMRCLHPSPMHGTERAHESSFLSSASQSYGQSYNNDQLDQDNGSSSGGGGFFSVTAGTRPMHAWELILEYYYLKHGDEYNNTPARKLSESFNLDIVDAKAMTAKQSLLSSIGMIIAMHRPYKRSMNAHFKAFVCAALNSHLLVEWLNLILSCNELIDSYYTPTSYVVRTGFRDSLRSIDALTKYDFHLPVDLAIRHFRNI